MSEAPIAGGAAGDAQVITTTAQPAHIRLAYAAHDADVADEVVDKMRTKLAMAQEAPNLVDLASEALAEALTEAATAHEKANQIRAEIEGPS